MDLTPEGSVLLAEATRLLLAADRAGRRVRAAARGEFGILRLAYTLTTVWDTTPALLARLGDLHRHLRVDAREVFGGDIEALLADGRYDLALAPRTDYPKSFHDREIRSERMRLAVGENHPLAARRRVKLDALSGERFEVWPREMSPGFYDTVLGICRGAGFEPHLDERAAGNTVWGYIARGRGVGLHQRVARRAAAAGRHAGRPGRAPQPRIAIDAVWHGREPIPVVERVLKVAGALGAERGWV